MPCASCGYDLTALTPAAACPECARPVVESVEEWRRWQGRRHHLVGSVLAASVTVASLIAVAVITSTQRPTDALELLVGSLIMAGVMALVLSFLAVRAPGPGSPRNASAAVIAASPVLTGAYVAVIVVDRASVIPWIGIAEAPLMLLATHEAAVGAFVAWRWRSALIRLAPRASWTATASTWLLGISAVTAAPALVAWSMKSAPGLRVLAPAVLTFSVACMALGCVAMAAAGVACVLAARRGR